MHKRRRAVRLEMTSLMDVMFLVLVFFIYCIFDMSVHKGVKVDLPNAGGALEKGERIVITIDSNNSMQLNGMSLDQKEIVSRVSQLMKVDDSMPVLIAGDKNSSLGTGVRLLADLKAAGVKKTSFQVAGNDQGNKAESSLE